MTGEDLVIGFEGTAALFLPASTALKSCPKLINGAAPGIVPDTGLSLNQGTSAPENSTELKMICLSTSKSA